MKKLKQSNFKMFLEVVYTDGSVDRCTDSAVVIRRRFSSLVRDCLDSYIVGVKEIRLLDCANRLFKSYTQNF